MQTNPAVEQNKTLNGPLVREISTVSTCTFTCIMIITGRKAGIKITLLGFFGSSPRGSDYVYRLSSNLAGRRWFPISYSLPKLKIFGGYLENFGSENMKSA